MGFNAYARRVRRCDLPFAHRRGALRSCIIRYCYLIQVKPQETYLQYVQNFEISEDSPQADELFNQAINALEKKRNLFLNRLRVFEKRRAKEKMSGRRSPAKAALATLYDVQSLDAKTNGENPS